jgi:hypothetical protein
MQVDCTIDLHVARSSLQVPVAASHGFNNLASPHPAQS